MRLSPPWTASWIACAALAASCAAPAPATPVKVEAAAAPRAERAAVLYDGDVARRGLPLPLVRGSVAGKPTWMVVDTGTGATVIAGWLARSLALATTKVVEPTHDPSGRPVVMERCDEPHVVIDGFDALADRATPVIDLPAPFEAAGIGVILSPQALASAESTIVLDMPRREMRRVRSRDLAASAGAPDGTFDVEHATLCSQPGPVFDNRRLTAKAIVDGVPAVLEVDTGAFGAPFFLVADSDAGKRVLARPSGMGETGLSAAGRLDVITARDVPVRVGSQDQVSNVTVMPGTRDAHCGVEGRLGLEWLSACVFTIGPRDYRLRCDVKHAANPT